MKSFGGWPGMWGNLDPHEARDCLTRVTPGTIMGWDSSGYRGGLGMVVSARELTAEECAEVERKGRYIEGDHVIVVVFAASRQGEGTKTYRSAELDPRSVVPLLDAEGRDPRLDERYGGNRHPIPDEMVR